MVTDGAARAPRGPGGAILPPGVVLRDVLVVSDARGLLVELDRLSWHGAEAPRQWNVMVSGGNTLRGLHVHLRHTDWIAGVAGEAVVGLVDLRGEPGTGRQVTVRLSADPVRVLTVPPGVLHGIYTPQSSVLLNGLSREYDPDDDLAVRFDDPAIALDWDVTDPVLSDRDRHAPTITSLRDRLARRGLALPEPGE